MRSVFAFLFLACGSCAALADDARTLCTIVADLEGRILVEEGPACAERVTPASTFKLALAVMGFDSGVLVDRDNPVLPFEEGYPDWIAEWRRPVGPADWIRHSVVWYSQQIARQMGKASIESYLDAFDYGNRDFSGDRGKGNALDRAWISSSLKIAPREQAAFLARLVAGRLPVSSDAADKAMQLAERQRLDGGWSMQGKTGSAYPRQADGAFDRRKGWGWYVGWAEGEGGSFVFAHLRQDNARNPGPGGLRARADFLKRWPTLAGALRNSEQ